MSCSAIASRPTVTCSPEATTTSYSQASYSRETSPHHLTSWLVVPDIADTTTATSLPASTSRLTRRATFLIRSTSPTEVPPNFITMRAIAGSVCRPRSEEHTSELQSLMRISYAVFCLQKQNI